MKRLIVILLVIFSLYAHSQQHAQQQYRNDFEYFWKTINDNYAYFDKKQTDWQKVKEIYAPMADTVTSRSGFIDLLERVFYELYDHHASLNTNTYNSQKLVPSGTDIWAEYLNGKPVITDVRLASAAKAAGIRPGMEIISFNNVPVEKALESFLPKTLKKNDIEAKNFALRTLLAGTHIGPRIIITREKGKEQAFRLIVNNPAITLLPVSFDTLKNNVGYIRFNDRLWDHATIVMFDSALQKLRNTSGIILDLRETPSGGNTTVARAIMGSFITKEGFYQKHELVSEENEFGLKRSWMEIVTPRSFIYKKKVVILVNHWTGRVGEGITIGFDALKRATIIGTPMAGLNGANYSFTMPETGIGFSFPAEKLFHVNGTPREKFRPHVVVKPTFDKKDEMLIEAMKMMR